MVRRLTDFINLETLHITLEDIAQAVEKPAENSHDGEKGN